jgi:hypothetical protein
MHPLELRSLTLARRREIIEQFWGATGITKSQQNTYEDGSYFEYFETQCQLARQYDLETNFARRTTFATLYHNSKRESLVMK